MKELLEKIDWITWNHGDGGLLSDNIKMEIIKLIEASDYRRMKGFSIKQIEITTGYSLSELMSQTRKREIVQRRMLGMWLMNVHTGLSLTEIGSKWSYSDGPRKGKPRHHATVLHGIRTIDILLDTEQDRELSNEAKELNEYYIKTIKFSDYE